MGEIPQCANSVVGVIIGENGVTCSRVVLDLSREPETNCSGGL
jgi:hypothetical protein